MESYKKRYKRYKLNIAIWRTWKKNPGHRISVVYSDAFTSGDTLYGGTTSVSVLQLPTIITNRPFSVPNLT